MSRYVFRRPRRPVEIGAAAEPAGIVRKRNRHWDTLARLLIAWISAAAEDRMKHAQ